MRRLTFRETITYITIPCLVVIAIAGYAIQALQLSSWYKVAIGTALLLLILLLIGMAMGFVGPKRKG